MARRKRQREKQAERELARTRITTLLDLAHGAYQHGRPHRATRYTRIAARIAQRHRLRQGPRLRDAHCRACQTYLQPGANARIRLRNGHRTLTCLQCGHVRRHGYRC